MGGISLPKCQRPLSRDYLHFLRLVKLLVKL